MGKTLAFPGCEGAGCGSVGGRGGTVYKVTTLADSGPGSLRACVQASGPRTCVFTVGGRIQTTSEMRVRNPYLTIAGQTAQGGGIEVVGGFRGGYVFVVATHDVTVRYVRFFNDAHPACDASSQGCGVVSVLSPAENVVLDHLGSAFTQDESLAVWSPGSLGPKNITASWILNAYPLADHPTGATMCGKTRAASESQTDIDLHHNYFVNTSHRLPLACPKRARWAYNIVLNYQKFAARLGGGVVDDFVGNIYRCGNQSICTRYPLTLGGEPNWPAGTPSIFFHNNVWKDASGKVKVPGDASDSTQWSKMAYVVANSNATADSTTPAPTSYRRAAPNATPGTGTPIALGSAGPFSGFVVAADGTNLERAMFDSTANGDALRGTPYGPVGPSRRLDCNGNLVNNIDGLHQRAIAEYLGGGSATYAPSGGTRSPVTQTDICWGPGKCGVPSLAAGVACADADGDGMPDAWESHWGLSSRSASSEDGPNGHRLSVSFTNLEMYLSGFKGF